MRETNELRGIEAAPAWVSGMIRCSVYGRRGSTVLMVRDDHDPVSFRCCGFLGRLCAVHSSLCSGTCAILLLLTPAASCSHRKFLLRSARGLLCWDLWL